MSFFTALLDAAGGFGAGRQQRFQNQLAQQQLTADTQYRTTEADLEKQRAQQEQQRFNIEQRQAGYDPSTGQQLPTTAKYLPIPPSAKYDDIATIGARNYAIAVEANDPAGIERWGKFAAVVPKGFQETAGGQYDLQGRIPLAQAQAAFWKEKPAILREQMRAEMARVGAQQAGAMQRAYVSANAAMARTQYSGDEREAIAIQTALNVAQGKSQQQAYQEAKDKADQQDKINLDVYNREAAAATKLGEQLPEPPAPTPITVSTGAPSVSVTVVDPQTGQLRQVSNVKTKTTGGGNASARWSVSQAEAALQGVSPDMRGQYINEAVKEGKLSPADALRVRSYFGLAASGDRGF